MQDRRIRIAPSTGLGPTTLLGLGLGLVAGFVLGELFGGPIGRRSLRRAISGLPSGNRARPWPPTRIEELRRSVAEALGPDAPIIELGSAGPTTLVLRGWVATRAARRLATRLVRESLPAPMVLVDRLLVLGEDDRPIPEIPLREEPDPA